MGYLLLGGVVLILGVGNGRLGGVRVGLSSVRRRGSLERVFGIGRCVLGRCGGGSARLGMGIWGLRIG